MSNENRRNGCWNHHNIEDPCVEEVKILC